eukprot:1075827-Pleurochrysis_carterae.AAC.1
MAQLFAAPNCMPASQGPIRLVSSPRETSPLALLMRSENKLLHKTLLALAQCCAAASALRRSAEPTICALAAFSEESADGTGAITALHVPA